jgi:hypothetical protein
MPKLVPPEENPGTRKLLGVFTAPPPQCIGEPYNDKRIVDPRHQGKGLASGLYRADGRTEVCAPGTFKLSPFLFANEDMKGKDPYKEGIRYKDVYKNGDKRPKGAPKYGFGTADFPKRDEYTNTMRTEQLREVLRREVRVVKANQAMLAQRLKASGKDRPQTATVDTGNMKALPLFDVVFRIPEPSFRLPRDDRQGRYFYMAERQRQRRIATGEAKDNNALAVIGRGASSVSNAAPAALNGSTWVNIKLPNETQMQVLVNENRVVARRPMTAHVSRAGINL